MQTLEGEGAGHQKGEALQVEGEAPQVGAVGRGRREKEAAAAVEEAGEAASQVLKAQLEAQRGLGGWMKRQGLSQTVQAGTWSQM